MTIYLLDRTLEIKVFYEHADQDLEDNICVSVVERCPPPEQIFRSGTTHLFMTADQARHLGEALLEAALQSQADSARQDS